MTERYEKIRQALEMGPTPGPRRVIDGNSYPYVAATLPENEGHRWDDPIICALYENVTPDSVTFGPWLEALPNAQANASFVAACDPDTIRELLAERDQLAAAQQQPVEGEEIMVNTPYDVFTLPLRPSGLSSGPRFVVHVPGPEAQDGGKAAPPSAPVGVEEMQRRLDREESDHGRTIDQRDAAEDALGRMFQAVTGRTAEWSSAWGYVDAIEEVEEHVATLATERDQLAAALESAREYGWQPIETAPKDGTRVLLRIEWSGEPVVGEFTRDRWWACTEHHEVSCGTYCYGGSVTSDKDMKPIAWARIPPIDATIDQALLEERDALAKDAAKYRWGINNARWIRSEHEAYVAFPVAPDADLSCVAMRDAAIDDAMSKEGRGDE